MLGLGNSVCTFPAQFWCKTTDLNHEDHTEHVTVKENCSLADNSKQRGKSLGVAFESVPKVKFTENLHFVCNIGKPLREAKRLQLKRGTFLRG